MNYFKICFIAAVLVLIAKPVAAVSFGYGFNSDDNKHLAHHTPQLSLMPEPISTKSIFKTAGITWLPDWQWDTRGYSNRTEDDKGGGDVGGSCAKYGMVNSCSAPKVFEGKPQQPLLGLTCYKNCRCPDGFSQNCSGNHIGIGTACDGKYQSCQCRPEFNKDAVSCKISEGFRPSSNTCDGKSDSCDSLPCSSGGFIDSPQKDRKCTAAVYGGRNCYTCNQPTCSEGGFQDDVPANNKCTATTYFGRTCQSNCYQPTCAEGGYKDTIPVNNTCSAVSYYGHNCQTACYQPTCVEGGFRDDVPANNKCTATTYFGRTCQSNCYQPTCAAGGYKDTVPTNNICTPVSYYGRTCQSNCSQPTCAVGGYKDTVPAYNKCTPVTYYGRTCQSNCQFSCANNCTLSYCPVGGDCTKEACSGKYCMNGCSAGYKMCNGSCISEKSCCGGVCPWPSVCHENSCYKCNNGGFELRSSATIPSDCYYGTLKDYNGDGASYTVPTDRNSYSSLSVYPQGVHGNNSVMNIYGDVTIKELSLMPPLTAYTQVCNNASPCNATINFFGNVTVTESLYYVSKVITSTQTFNVTVNFKKGISGSYKCRKTAIEGWYGDKGTFTNICPNGGEIQ